MNVIERKECPEHGAAYGWDNDGALVKCIHCGADLSRTKYVPAEQLRGAVSDRDALRLMLSRLLDVALVDGYGETVADEARALLTTIGGAVAR
jgi:hypothetical protein